MPIGLVREVSHRLISPGIVRGIVSLAVLATLAACSNETLAGPGDANLITNRDGVVRGPSRLEQRLAAKVEAPPAGSPYTAQLTVTSTIVNTGSAAVTLTSRVCLFLDDDIETTAQMSRFEPLISCAAIAATGDLAPGQSTAPMEVKFGVRSGAGTYTLKLRHAVSPEFRGEVSFRIP